MKIFSSLIGGRLVATLSALAVVTIGCSAGIWQLNRAEQKIRLGDSLEARLALPLLDANGGTLSLEFAKERRISAHGRYLEEAAVWLDNRPRPIPAAGSNTAQSGFYLMMPMKLDGQETILWVNRGWAPRNNENRTQLPPVDTPFGSIAIEGVAFPHPGRVYELGKTQSTTHKPRIEQNFDLAQEAKTHGWDQLPFILRESATKKNDGLFRDWPLPTNGIERHYAYAFQWFALAIVGFVFWMIGGIMRYRRDIAVNGGKA